jgi:hypothetical protein
MVYFIFIVFSKISVKWIFVEKGTQEKRQTQFLQYAHLVLTEAFRCFSFPLPISAFHRSRANISKLVTMDAVELRQ